MELSDTLHRRMAFLFLLAVALIAWQAPRTKPAEIPPIEVATREGEQLYPIAIPEGPAAQVPRLASQRQPFLDRHSLPWAASAPTAGRVRDCEIYVRISAQHWARRPLGRSELARLAPAFDPFLPVSTSPTLRLGATDFADDDDGDGDPLDAGELRPAATPGGAEVEAFCRR